jgi:glutamine---fructose-6-phosphate transaminase (isomerizing)
MFKNDYVTRNEILTQTSAWEDAINVIDQNREKLKALALDTYQRVLVIGCGSTYYLALTAASLLQKQTGVMVMAFPSSELLLFPESLMGEGKNLLFAFSRSGTTSETLHVVNNFKQNNQGKVIVITNYQDSPLAKLGDICLGIREGQELSVAQTRSFASMLVAIYAVSHLISKDISFSLYKKELVLAGNNLFKNYSFIAEKYGTDNQIKQVFFLGSGPRYGLACEASLKMKEMSQTVTEPFHFLEFRHGPISMVDEHTLVIGLVSEKAFDHEMAVIEEVRRLGAETVTIGEKDTDIEFKSELPEAARDVLYLPILQLLAYQRAIFFGKNPDIPRNLTAVVKLDL